MPVDFDWVNMTKVILTEDQKQAIRDKIHRDIDEGLRTTSREEREAGAAEFDRLFESARKKHEQENMNKSWSFKLGKALRK